MKKLLIGLMLVSFMVSAEPKKEEVGRYKVCEEIKPQGSMIVFPSFLHHCVAPVTSGTRYSLVIWCCGKPYI